MNDDLKGRAMRAASAVLSETNIVRPYREHEQILTALAAAWLDGYKAGTADALSVVGDVA